MTPLDRPDLAGRPRRYLDKARDDLAEEGNTKAAADRMWEGRRTTQWMA